MYGVQLTTIADVYFLSHWIVFRRPNSWRWGRTKCRCTCGLADSHPVPALRYAQDDHVAEESICWLCRLGLDFCHSLLFAPFRGLIVGWSINANSNWGKSGRFISSGNLQMPASVYGFSRSFRRVFLVSSKSFWIRNVGVYIYFIYIYIIYWETF